MHANRCYIIVVTLLVVFACNKKSTTIATTWKWDAVHTQKQIHPYFDSLYSAVLKVDTTEINKQFAFCLDTLYALTYDTVPPETILSYYDAFFSIWNTAKKSPYILEKEAKLLQNLVYINSKYDKDDATIKYFNILNRKELQPYFPSAKKADRLIDVGPAYHKIGDYNKAKETYLETIELAKKLEDYELIAMATINLNIYKQEQKEYDGIINISKALLTQNINPKYKSKLALNIAAAYYEKNEMQQMLLHTKLSERYLLNVDSSDRPEDYVLRLALVNKQYAHYYKSIKDTKKADAYFATAENLLKSEEKNFERDLGKLYIEIGNYKQDNKSSTLPSSALVYYNKALKTIVPNFNVQDTLAYPSDKELNPENLFLDALDAKAKYLENNYNDKINAETYYNFYTTAFKVEKLLLNNFVYDNSKIDFSAESKNRAIKAVAVCYNAYQKTKETKWVDRALQFIENNKATVLIEKLKHNKLLQDELGKDSLVRILKTLKIKKAGATAEKEQGEFTKQIDDIEQQLLQKYPNLAKQNVYDGNLTVAAIKSNLNKELGLLNYFYNHDTLYTIYIDKQFIGFTKQLVPQNSITNYKNNCSNLVYQQTKPNDFFTTSHQIYKWLIPTTISKKVTELVILSNEAIDNLNFESLLIENYKSLNSNIYLLQNYTINYCYSYNSYQQKNVFGEAANNILVCTPASKKQLRGQDVLNHSLEEAIAIKKIFTKTQYLNDTQATTQNFKKAYNNYQIVHLATHSIPDSVTGNALIDLYDTPLQATELQQNNTLNTSLVFLSACETAVGKNTNTEGVLSLARSMYYAGAQNIIASQWKINDAASATIVADFYNAIKYKKYAVALQGAKLNYLKNASTEKKLPFYWASYTHIGYQTTYKTKNYYWIALVGFLLFLISVVFLLKNKSKTIVKLRNLNFFRK